MTIADRWRRSILRAGVALAVIACGCGLLFGCARVAPDGQPSDVSLTDLVPESVLPGPMKVVSGARTWTVRPGRNGSAAPIQEAVNKARPGDTIFLEPGIYLWNVRDSKDEPPEPPVVLKQVENLTLRSDGEAYVFCTHHAAMPLELFTARHVLIEGVHFGHAGILGYTCTAATVWIYDSRDITFRNCVLHGSGLEAVGGWNNERILFDGCALGRGTAHGVDLSFTKGLTLWRSYLTDNGTDPSGGCLLDFANNRDLYFFASLFDRNANACFHNLDRTANVFFRDNVFYANRFVVPDSLEPGPNAVIHRTPGTDSRALERSAVWPSKKTRNAAKRYRKFLDVLKSSDLLQDGSKNRPADDKPQTGAKPKKGQ
jgi:hypothetical protein